MKKIRIIDTQEAAAAHSLRSGKGGKTTYCDGTVHMKFDEKGSLTGRRPCSCQPEDIWPEVGVSDLRPGQVPDLVLRGFGCGRILQKGEVIFTSHLECASSLRRTSRTLVPGDFATWNDFKFQERIDVTRIQREAARKRAAGKFNHKSAWWGMLLARAAKEAGDVTMGNAVFALVTENLDRLGASIEVYWLTNSPEDRGSQESYFDLLRVEVHVKGVKPLSVVLPSPLAATEGWFIEKARADGNIRGRGSGGFLGRKSPRNLGALWTMFNEEVASTEAVEEAVSRQIYIE